MSLESLYQEVILDHYKSPANHGTIEGPHVAIHQENPSCGDQITLQLVMDGDVVKDVKFTGVGCAISQASASMMTLAVIGKTRAETHQVIDQFREMLMTDAEIPDELGDLESLRGVRKFPVRVKCAMLAWKALHKLLDESVPNVEGA